MTRRPPQRGGARGRARRGAGRARHGPGRGRRERLAELVADVDEGEVGARARTRSRSFSSSGSQTGRLRALYGPGGEQAALLAFRKLPRGAELAAGAARGDRGARRLEGKRIDSVSLANAGPGAYVLSLAADGLELSCASTARARASTRSAI